MTECNRIWSERSKCYPKYRKSRNKVNPKTATFRQHAPQSNGVDSNISAKMLDAVLPK